jgi:shikimate dehydrogenase
MHNAAIAALGLHYVYIPFSVPPDQLGPAIRSLVALGIIGVNLTIPHKERVLAYLDQIAPEAQALGAVNTVHHVGSRLIGYNTDDRGFAEPLGAAGFSLPGKRAVVLGAGGAARAVAHRLARDGAQVTLVNRTPERAQALADQVNRSVGKEMVDCLRFEERTRLTDVMIGAQLLVNTTSVGMSPDDQAIPPIPLNALHPGLFVYDLIYRPQETRLLAAARAVGAPTLNGVAMLVHQGAAAFEIWTGIRPPLDVMERAVLAGLQR